MDIRIFKNRLFFTSQDVANANGISPASAHVLCSRYVRKGLFIRVKKNFYILEQNWERYSSREFFQVCNYLQVPSYVSCMTALVYYGITTQVQQDWYENITTRRSVSREALGVCFLYHKINPQYYSGFIKESEFFMALPEKALIDAAYLANLGGSALDWDSMNLDLLKKTQLSKLMAPYPEGVKSKIMSRCSI
ncbi:type IV toxin-antitoxin system AbiEi family antitoxin domain-containing protein [Thermodesulfobacteriota bacterium]